MVPILVVLIIVVMVIIIIVIRIAVIISRDRKLAPGPFSSFMSRTVTCRPSKAKGAQSRANS